MSPGSDGNLGSLGLPCRQSGVSLTGGVGSEPIYQLMNMCSRFLALFVEGDAGEYSPGLDSNWRPTFEAQVKRAAAIAVLAGE